MISFVLLVISWSSLHAQITLKVTQDIGTDNSYTDGTATPSLTGPAREFSSNAVQMSNYTNSVFTGTTIVNYIGEMNSMTFADAMAALKFTLPPSAGVLASVKLRFKIMDVGGSPIVTIRSTDDNAWVQENTATSHFTLLINPTTLVSSASINASDAGKWKEFDITSYIASRMGASSTIVSMILTGSPNSGEDNFFNFVADDNLADLTGGSPDRNKAVIYDANADVAQLVLTYATPSLTTQTVSSITNTTATGNGNIISLGTSNITAYGICWNTTGAPTTTDSNVNLGAKSATGTFTVPMTGLIPGTTYHARTFATNASGTVYGDEVTFVTQKPGITSATYAVNTGLLSLTCTNITAGDNINPAKITLTGEGGMTYTLTSANTTASSSTLATITLNATDKAAVNQIFNKNGTRSTNTTLYNVAAADDWDASMTAGDISDLTGNGITVSSVAVPTITSATYDAATGELAVTGTGFLKSNGAANDIDVSKFTITGEGGATYTLTTGGVEISSGTTFAATLNATDKTSVNQIINKNGTASTGGTTYNLAAAEDWAAGADAAVVVADPIANAIIVSNVSVPTITSATYDATSGALVVTGTGFLKLSGTANDINVSKLTVTGEGGATYTLTTPSVDISSGTSFTVTLNATDKTAVNQIINKNGTASTGGTAYNLAAAEDWSVGADAAVVVADLTGNGITVSNVAIPTITGATYDAATGTLSVTGTGFLKLNGASNDINVSKFSIKGEGDATYALTTADVEISSGTSFAITLNATDKFALTQIINKNGSASNSGTAYNLAANEDWAAGMDAMAIVADLTGNGIVVSNITAPGAPTIVTVTPENTQASVSFTAPASNGGSAIIGYTVVSSPGGRIGSGSSSPITVAGLTNGIAYTFTVTATNAVGTSVASAASTSVIPNMTQTITFTNPGVQSFGTAPQLSATATSGLPVVFSTTTPDVCSITSGGVLTFLKAGTCTILADQAGNTAYTAAPTVSQTFTVNAVAPGAPTIGAVAPGDAQATVSFTAPVQDGGSPITSFTVTANPGNLVATAAVSPITITGLTNGTTYTFTVAASNSGGTSAVSAASGSVTPIGTQTIVFTNPGTQNFGTTPQLSATTTSGLKVTFSTTTPDVCSITSEGTLTFLKTGTCTILADQAGNTAWSAAPTVSQTFMVNAVIPGVPTIGTAISGNAQATVSFIAPTFDGGSPITSYMVTASPGGITATGISSPITVTGLSNGTGYTFTVIATNSVGTTTASATSNMVTAFTLPVVTTAAASSISSSTVVLNGTVNANGASTVASFEYGLTPNYGTTIVADQSPANAASISTVSKTISGLTPNTTYHYRIVGVNAAGTTNGLDQTFTTSLNTALDNTMENGFAIYPNPATDGFTINAGDQPTLVFIYDLSGSLLLTQLANGKTYIPVGLLNPGVYVVKANERRIKLVKKTR